MSVKNLKGMATDSLLLISVRCITIIVNIIQTMILTRVLSPMDYGTYSEGLLILSFIAPFLSLGLQDSVNYFYNKSSKSTRGQYINTIFTISLMVGIFGALIILFLTDEISGYFKNPQIAGIVIFLAFRPCLQNLIALYQPLYISIDKAKIVAVRNLIVSIVQVSAVWIVSFLLQSITIIFLSLLILDILQIVFFDFYLRNHGTAIRFFIMDKALIRPILRFALPMLLASSIATINLNLDKLMISSFMGVVTYALYANVSKELPFAFIAQSLTSVVTPTIVKLLNSNRLDEFRTVWSDYLQFGYTVSWPFIFGAIFFAPVFINFLYSSKYLTSDGILIFRIYLLATMLRFTYFGIVPTALGKTKVVLKYSILGMLINVALNYILYCNLGIIGPSIATVISMIIPAIFYFNNSVKATNSSFLEIIKIKELIKLVIMCIVVGLACVEVFNIITNLFTMNKMLLGCFFYALYCLIVFSINIKNIKCLLGRLNKSYV